METYQGKTIPLYVDRTTSVTADGQTVVIPGDFKLVVCLTQTGIAMSNSQIDTTSFCTGIYTDSIPGKVSGSISGSGQQVLLSGSEFADMLNHNDLMDMINTQEIAWWALFDSALNTVRYVVGYLTSYEETNPEGLSTFTLSVVAKGEVFTQTSS